MHRVILVDDEVLIREAISENIGWKALNCELVGCFQNGREAIHYIRENPVDIVITDICMPYVDGLELSQMIFEEFKNIKILIFSGYDNFDYAKKAMKYNVEDYLLKPLTSQELTEVLGKLGERIDKQRIQSQRYSQIATSYQKNKLLLRSQTLLKQVQSGRSDVRMREELEQYNIHLDQKYYRIIVLCPQHNDAYLGEKSLMNFVMFNVAQEILSKYDQGQVFQGEGGQTFLLMAANVPAALEIKLLSMLTEICSSLKWVAQLAISVSVGMVIEGTWDLPQSYEDALEGLQYAYTREAEIIVHQNIANLKQQQSDYPRILEQLLLAVKHNTVCDIHQIFAELGQLIRASYLRKARVHIIIQNIINDIKYLLEKACLKENLIYYNSSTVLEVAMEKDNLTGALAVLKQYLLEAGAAMETQKVGIGKQRAVLALEYMDKHYMNPELSVAMLCEHLGMSASRFSAMFKEHTSMTFMESLINLRMEKAQELIEHTRMKNYEIAGKVGFSDPHYFGISFKKATGMTPTEFAREKRAFN